MYYHPIIGILIFLVAIVISFLLGRVLLKKSLKNSLLARSFIKKNNKDLEVTKGEITSPDAPWLNEKSK